MMHLLKVKNVFQLCTQTVFRNLFLLIILGFQDCSNAGSSVVKFLPGFDGPLPFDLETEYIGVGESEDVQLFYYFIKSESNPAKDPLLLWFTGGPGCSSLCVLLFEIGPIIFADVHFLQEISLPKLVLNPYSWTKWLIDHPQFLSNQFYVGGDSYSGIPVPIVTQLISDGNDIRLRPKINLKGYVLGNPFTSLAYQDIIPQYAHGMGLISDELFESLKEACRGKYYDVDPKNILCLQNMQTFNELLRDIDPEHILLPFCPSVLRQRKLSGGTRDMYEKYHLNLVNQEKDSPIQCRYNWYEHSRIWANDKNVQEAIHIRKGTIGIGVWNVCKQNLSFTESIVNSVGVYQHPALAYTRTYANKMTFATVMGAGHTAPEYRPRECRAMFERWLSHQPL